MGIVAVLADGHDNNVAKWKSAHTDQVKIVTCIWSPLQMFV